MSGPALPLSPGSPPPTFPLPLFAACFVTTTSGDLNSPSLLWIAQRTQLRGRIQVRNADVDWSCPFSFLCAFPAHRTCSWLPAATAAKPVKPACKRSDYLLGLVSLRHTHAQPAASKPGVTTSLPHPLAQPLALQPSDSGRHP